ncbi:MAG: cupin domain-containing protein [Sedimentisphaerales bacterium]
MNEKKEKAGLLQACLGKGQNLSDLIGYAKDSIVSKIIIEKAAGTITLFAFDKGQKLSEHTAPYDAVVHILEGKALIRIDGKDNDVSSGEIIIMPSDVPHSVAAQEQFKMLLTMIRIKGEQ